MNMGKLSGLALLASAGLSGAALAETVVNGGRPFTTQLSGANEVNASGTPNQGDPDGTGTARITINPGQGRICYDITVSGIATPTRGHIHRAPAGSNGAIVVPFFEANAVDLSDCVDVTRALATEIIQHPERFYVNVHNADFPAGAMRGQLAKK